MSLTFFPARALWCPGCLHLLSEADHLFYKARPVEAGPQNPDAWALRHTRGFSGCILLELFLCVEITFLLKKQFVYVAKLSNFVEKSAQWKIRVSPTSTPQWSLGTVLMFPSRNTLHIWAAVSIASFFITQMVAYSLPTACCFVLCLLHASLTML